MKLWLAAAAVLGVVSCSQFDKDIPPLQGTVRGDDPRAAKLLAEAQGLEAAGDQKKAIKTYARLADNYPVDKRSAEAKFRQATLLKARGEELDSFDAYQQFIERHPGDRLYPNAIAEQEAVAYAAAQGAIRTNFLGLKSRLERKTIVEMLEKVRDNAPRANSAPKAQFTIGQVNEFSKKPGPAIAAYEKMVDDYPNANIAADAQFRIGEILLKEANQGNQDQANLERARNAFRDLLIAYPASPFAEQAKQRVATIGSRDLQSSFNIGEFYRKKGEMDSAAYYYQDVINRTTAGDLRNRAAAQLSRITN